jgi:hypothetical protein
MDILKQKIMITKGIGLQGLGMKGNKGYSIGSPSALLKKEGLWANIHAKKKSGKTMRKKGDPGAPTEQAYNDAQGK